MTFCTCDFITDRSIASYQEIVQSIPVEDKLATTGIFYTCILQVLFCISRILTEKCMSFMDICSVTWISQTLHVTRLFDLTFYLQCPK